LNNLISNAIKFTEKGEVRISTRLLSKNEKLVTLQMEVKDSGIGIPEKSMNSIFESFTQASSETTRKFGGTGLGLTIVKRIIELQGGTIQVKSKEGQGTSFIFTIEMDIAAVIPPAITAPEVKTTGVSLSDLRILIVEDNKINQLVVKKIVGEWQCSLEFADNGKIAVEKAGETKFDLILMDIQMPIMDGYTAARTIRGLGTGSFDSPIIAMTAHAMAAEKQKCFDQGMTDYLCKPFDPEELKKKIIMLTQKAEVALNDTQAEMLQNQVIEVRLQPRAESRQFQHSPEKQAEIEKFLNAPKINLTYLKQIADGNDAFVIEMIEMFINKTPMALEEMTENFRKQNWDEIRKIAHRIRPSYGYIGMSDIQNTLLKIETLSEDHRDPEQVNSLIQEVESFTRQACDLLKGELVSLK
jgi:CheY-like chemotaxis protein